MAQTSRPMQRPVRVGMVGVNAMGSRMAEALIGAGIEVVARDISPTAEQRAAQMGASIARCPKEMAECTDLTLMSLPGPAQVESVVCASDGLLAGARPGFIIVDMSTVDPETTRRNAEQAQKVQVGYLDAPVLGRPQGCGKWTLPVGGDEDVLARCRGVLGTLAQRIVHVGPSGSGNTVKLLNNMMFGVINAVTVEVMTLCAKTGVDPGMFYDVVAQSGAATVSNLFVELVPKILARDFEPRFSIDLLHKDLLLGVDLAREADVPLLITPSALLLASIARSKGLGKADTGGEVRVYEELMDVVVARQAKT